MSGVFDSLEYRYACLLVLKADVIGLGMKGRIWLTKASRVRSSVWKVGDKRPGKPSLVGSSLSSFFFFCNLV